MAAQEPLLFLRLFLASQIQTAEPESWCVFMKRLGRFWFEIFQKVAGDFRRVSKVSRLEKGSVPRT